MENKEFICPICNKRLRGALKSHVKNVHSVQKQIRSCRLVCPFENCNEKFTRDAYLREHLKEHGVEVEFHQLEFDTESDMEKWLYSVQNETGSEFVKNCSTKTLASGYKKDLLYCSRSYQSKYITDFNRKRNCKSQGSRKINRACPARVEIMRKDGEKIRVRFWKTHCGHSSDLGHLRLDKHTKNKIAAKLMSGANYDDVLEEVRSLQETTQNKRLLLLNRQDLYNILREYNASFAKKHQQDAEEGIKLETEEVEDLGEESPDLYFEPQGDLNEQSEVENFICVLSEDFQTSQLKKSGHGKERVGGTHRTKPYPGHSSNIKTEVNVSTAAETTFEVPSHVKNRKLVEKAQIFATVLQQHNYKKNFLRAMDKQLDSLIILAINNGSVELSGKSVEKVDGNKNVGKKVRSSSTKKKGSCSFKPTKSEINSVVTDLSNEDAEIVYIQSEDAEIVYIQNEDDHAYCRN